MKNQLKTGIMLAVVFVVTFGLANVTKASQGYEIKNGQVYYYDKVMDKADAKTFVIIKGSENYYAKDKNNVYLGENIVDEFTPDDFSADTVKFDPLLKDENNVYFACEGNLEVPPSNAASDVNRADIDIKSVKLLKDGFFVDKNHVYFTDKFNYYCNFNKFEGVDPGSFETLNFRYEKDKNKVFYNTFYHGTKGITLLNGADVKTFVALGGSYAKDKNYVYYFGVTTTSFFKILGADNRSFKVLYQKKDKDFSIDRIDEDSLYAIDKNAAYYYGKKIPKADSRTFTVLDDNYSKDKNYVYYQGDILKGAKTASFKLLNEDYSVDKNYVYYAGKIIKNADRKTFAIMSERYLNKSDYEFYAIDKNNIYHGSEKVSLKISIVNNSILYNQSKGKVVLVKENNWLYYISPTKKEAYAVYDSVQLFEIMRKLGTKISNANLNKIPVGDGCPKGQTNCDKPGSYDKNYSQKQAGKILLQYQKSNEAWYVDPISLKRYYLGKPMDAFNKMKKLAAAMPYKEFDKILAKAKTCRAVKLGLQFDYPSTWGECTESGEKISFRTDYNKYQVKLVAEIRNYTEYNKNKSQPGYTDEFLVDFVKSGYDKVNINNGVIFKEACGGAFACTGLVLDKTIYEIGWEIESNQPAPTDTDGIWSPDHNVTQTDVWNILKSVKRIK